MNIIRLLLQTSAFDLILAVVAGTISGGCAAGLIALINSTLNQGIFSTNMLIWSFVALCLVRLITNFISQVLLIHLSQTAIVDLRMHLSRRILASPLSHLEKIGSHRLLAALTEDIQAISNTVLIIPFFAINIAILIACNLYLFYLSKTVFIVAFSFLILGILSYQLPMMKAMSFLKLAREQEDKLFKHFRAIIQGTKELKLHKQRQQAFLAEDLYTTALSHRHHHFVGMAVFAAAASWGQILFFVAIGLLLFTLPTIANVSPVILSAYALTIIYMMTPLEHLMSILPNLTRALVALNKVESLGLSLTSYPDENGVTNNLTPKKYGNCLKLINVTHNYYQEREERSFILGPINLTFHAGELIFIVGGNGSGKSTLAKLITGLYLPESGNIDVDGTLINQHNLEWYRQQFSVVFSDFYLFDRLLGLDSSNLDTQTKNYLIQLQLDHKVQIKNGVLSSTDLSQGQRKRLALLTTYLEDRPIYLFDEWASDQDPLFKKIFYTQLLPELKSKGKTVLVISHDDQYFYLADRIIKLEGGQVKYCQAPAPAI